MRHFTFLSILLRTSKYVILYVKKNPKKNKIKISFQTLLDVLVHSGEKFYTQNLTHRLPSSHECSSLLQSHLPNYSANFINETPDNVEVSKAAIVFFTIHKHKNCLRSEVALIFLIPRKHNVM